MAIYKVTAEEGVDYNGEHLPFDATFDLAEGEAAFEGIEAVPVEEAVAEEAALEAAPEGEAVAEEAAA